MGLHGVEGALAGARSASVDEHSRGAGHDPVSRPQRKLKDEHEVARAREACREFEAIFIQKMLSSMRQAFETENDENSDFGGDIFKSMMDEHLSVALAKSGGIGLAGLLAEGLGIEEDTAARAVRPAGRVPAEIAYRAYEQAKNDAGIIAYEPAIRAAASDSGVSENLIKAVILQESGGDPRAVSAKGAKGLMQLMDKTAAELGVRNVFSPVENIRGGARYLAGLIEQFRGNLELALASYNAGIGTVRKYGGVPPFEETRNYVKQVMARLNELDSASGG